MEASGVGVNSPEFLQKKIERLKTALDEANALMDRHVTERDEARAQLDAVKRENDELKRELAQSGGQAPAAAEAPGLDPALEQELRDRIAALEAERDTLQAATSAGDGGDGDRELLARVAVLQNELSTAQRAAADAPAPSASARADAAAARTDDVAAPTEA